MTSSRSRAVLAAASTAVIMTVAAAALAPSAIAAEKAVLNTDRPGAVSDSYVVVLKDSAVVPQDVTRTARSLAGRHGGRIGHTYSAALRGFAITVDARTARRIAADPAVAYVEQNTRVTADGYQTDPPWGLDRIDQRSLPLSGTYSYPSTTSAVHAYILDTGIRFSHAQFGGRAVSGYDAIDGGSADDCDGHGTHVAGAVGGSTYGVAKSATLIAVRVLDCFGNGTTAGVIAGVDWVTANAVKPAVANMSLGGPASTALDTAVTNSINSGVPYVVSAGNSNADACNQSPARVPAAITVGATTSTDARWSNSNWGTCLDLFAPGSGITSAWHTSDTAVATDSGTSMAAPHVTGAATFTLLAAPAWSPEQIRNHLVNTATSGVVGNPGSGSPNRLLYSSIPTVRISGPSAIVYYGTYTYTAIHANFINPTFTWSRRFCSRTDCTSWSQISGGGATVNQALSPDCSGDGRNNYELRVVVRNGDGRQYSSNHHTWLCVER